MIETLEAIDLLKGRRENHNSYGVPAARAESVTAATEAAEGLYGAIIGAGYEWHPAHIGSDEHGDVAFEWWNCGRTLTIYVKPDCIEFLIAVDGCAIDEMIDGEIYSSTDYCRLWEWMFHGAEFSLTAPPSEDK